jgi:hypothetical protein
MSLGMAKPTPTFPPLLEVIAVLSPMTFPTIHHWTKQSEGWFDKRRTIGQKTQKTCQAHDASFGDGLEWLVALVIAFQNARSKARICGRRPLGESQRGTATT